MRIALRTIVGAIAGGLTAWLIVAAGDKETDRPFEFTPRDKQMFDAGVTLSLTVQRFESHSNFYAFRERAWHLWTNGAGIPTNWSIR